MRNLRRIIALLVIVVTFAIVPVYGHAATGSKSLYVFGARYSASYYVDVNQAVNRARAGITITWLSGSAANYCSGRVSVVAVGEDGTVLGGSIANYALHPTDTSVSKSCSFIPDDGTSVYLAQGAYYFEEEQWILNYFPAS